MNGFKRFKKPRRFVAIAGALAITLSPLAGLAVGTSHWVHTSEADFKAGKFENVVATNLGDVKLSRAVKTLLEQDPKVSSVYALAEAPDGTIYAGTGPQGVLLSIKNEKIETVATLKDQNIFAVLIDKEGRVLLGTGGEKGRILRIDKPGDAPKELFTSDDVQYVWSLTQTPDGNLYAATGPNGQLLELQPNGSHQVLLDSDEHNLLSLLSDGKDTLYAGTDPHGLVYRINRKTKETFVLYDASESEVSALAMDNSGNLYAGTAEATGLDDTPDTGAKGSSEQTGRPENAPGGVPIPSVPPSEPKPPELPPPNPGEPAPIPKDSKETKEPLKLLTEGDAEKGADDPEDRKPPPVAPMPTKPAGGASKPPMPRAARAGAKGAEPASKGNAIYKIDPDGFVTEVFRQPVLVLSLLAHDSKLLAGTGSDGTVYQVDPAAEETIALAKVDPKQVMALMHAKDGRVFIGLANVGSIAAMSPGFAPDGTYTSPVLDASQVSRFGKMRMQGSLPEGSTIKVSTRSGNVEAPEDKGWSNWTDPVPASQYLQINSPSARFLQYRLTLASDAGKQSPVVEEVDVSYQVPNLAPIVKSVHIATSGAPASKGSGSAVALADADRGADASKPKSSIQTITWESSDPNNDALVYSLHYRQGSRGNWILLKDKLKETTYDWETRSAADGDYVIRVTASDESANARGTGKTTSRVSDPLSVDNTPPVIGDLKWQKQPGGAKIDLKVIDRATTVAGVDYAVDSSTNWQAVPPSDNIFDTPEESASFSVPDLTPGAHQISIRATDSRGNPAFETLTVTVEGK